MEVCTPAQTAELWRLLCNSPMTGSVLRLRKGLISITAPTRYRNPQNLRNNITDSSVKTIIATFSNVETQGHTRRLGWQPFLHAKLWMLFLGG